MGLHGSELGLDKSDASVLSTLSSPPSLSKSGYKSNGDGSNGATSMAEDSGFEKGVDEHEEGVNEHEEGLDEDNEDVDEDGEEGVGESESQKLTLKSEPNQKDESKGYKGALSRAELRKMQEELLYQEGDIENPNQMDLRVGKIIDIVPDDGNELLYISEIDLGSYDESRLVSTSLRDFYPERKDLLHTMVVILCNINPMDDRDIRSKTGMLLLATKTKFNEKGEEIGEYAELAFPTLCDHAGARIYVDGYSMDKPQPPKDEEYFDFVLKDFTVNSTGQVVWRGLPLKIEGYPDSKILVESLNDTYCKLD